MYDCATHAPLPPPSSHSHSLLPGIAQILTLVKVIASIGYFLIQDPSHLARLVSELAKYLGNSVIGLVKYLGDLVISLVRCLCDLVKVSSFSFPSLLAAPLNSASIRQFVVTLAVITAFGLAFVFAIFLDRDERRQTLYYLSVRMMGAGAGGEGL